MKISECLIQFLHAQVLQPKSSVYLKSTHYDGHFLNEISLVCHLINQYFDSNIDEKEEEVYTVATY